MAGENEIRIRQEVCRIGKMLHECSFVAGCDGNISARLGQDLVLGTPTGISKGMMEPEDLVVVDMGRAAGGRGGGHLREHPAGRLWHSRNSGVVVHAYPAHPGA